jgi:hypothetical protein
MSKLRTRTGDDHPEAAQKHLLDSQALLSQHRPDGAAYLSGYVVECALKSLWLHQTGIPSLGPMPWGKRGHDLNHLVSHAATLASVAGSKIAPYYKQAMRSLATSAIAAWKPEMRYQAPQMAAGDAEAWHKIADQVFQETVALMWLNGDA